MASGAYIAGLLSFPVLGFSSTHELPQGERAGLIQWTDIVTLSPILDENDDPILDENDDPILAGTSAQSLESFVTGSLTETRPISIRSLEKDALSARSFFDDYYNRIHLIPRVLDFGAVSGPESQTAILWNAHLTASVLSSVSETDPEGTEFVGPTLPKTFKPLEQVTLRIDANAEGPSSIAATYTLNFSSGRGSYPLQAFGSVAKLWSWAPNWRSPVTVSYDFRTQVITSRSGREQRIALRTTPRRSYEFEVTVNAAAYRSLQRLLHTWQNRVILLPDPVRKASVDAGMPAGADSILLSEAAPNWLVTDATVILVHDDQIDVRTVEDVNGLTVTFNRISGVSWPDDTIIRPAVQGMLSTSLRGSSPTNSVITLPVTFDVTPTSEDEDTSEPVEVFADREVFTNQPNWANAPTTTYIYPRETLDYGRGRVNNYFPIEFATRVRQAAFVGRTPAEIQAIAEFFCRQKGQRGEFYMPSGEDDLPLRHAPVGATNFIRVIGSETYDAYNGDSVFTTICILTENGSRIYRTVTDMYIVDDIDGRDTIIEVDTVWASDIDLDEILMVSWMPVWRYNSDRLQIEYLTDTVGQTQLNLRSLENLSAEEEVEEYDGATLWVMETWGEPGADVLYDLEYMVNTQYPGIWE